MEHPVFFSSRDVLSASVDGIGGTDLVFVDISEDGDSSQMQVSFSIPHPAEPGVMVAISGVGDEAGNADAAQESSCAAAVRALQQDHGYIVLDYSLFRVWECKNRFVAFSEKLQNGRDALSNVFSRSLVALHRIESTLQFFGTKIGKLGGSGEDVDIRNSAVACAGHLEAMHAQAMQGHTARAEQFEEINNPGDLSAHLLAAGFIVPDNQPDAIKLGGAMESILNRVATVLGYHDPVFEMRAEGNLFKCYIKFVASGNGQGRTFKACSRVAYDPISARHTALYNSLLAFSVNYNVLISDPNRNAYLFSKQRVDEIGSELGVLGELGNDTCSSIYDMIRLVNAMIGAYYPSFRGHAVGIMLSRNLQSLLSSLQECLDVIGPPVRTLNEEGFVGQLPY